MGDILTKGTIIEVQKIPLHRKVGLISTFHSDIFRQWRFAFTLNIRVFTKICLRTHFPLRSTFPDAQKQRYPGALFKLSQEYPLVVLHTPGLTVQNAKTKMHSMIKDSNL